MPPAVGQLLPHLTLGDAAGRQRPLAEAWAGGPALLLLGHRSCKTTRQTLPYVEQVHRRKGAAATVVAVLQDDAATARELVDEMGLTLPVLCEADPYPLTAALGVAVVPTLLLVERDGRIAAVGEAFRKSDLEAFAARLGVAGPLFPPDDPMPAFKPG
jgi:peroxiredoxin